PPPPVLYIYPLFFSPEQSHFHKIKIWEENIYLLSGKTRSPIFFLYISVCYFFLFFRVSPRTMDRDEEDLTLDFFGDSRQKVVKEKLESSQRQQGKPKSGVTLDILT